MTRYLCQVANVSPSGYYKWLRNAEKDALREESDYQDYLLLKSINRYMIKRKERLAIVDFIWH